MRVALRRAIIAHAGIGQLNRGPLGATIAFKTDGDDVLDEKEFQGEVFKRIDDQGKQILTYQEKVEALTKNIGDAPASIKTAVEELTSMKKTVNTQQASIDAFTAQLKKIEAAVRREALGNWTTPIQRIQRNEELRARLNGEIRRALLEENLKAGEKRAKDVFEVFTKALGEDSSPGSTLINQALANEIYDTLATFGVWNSFGVRPVGTKTTIFPVKTVRPTASWLTTEAATISDDTAKAGTTVSVALLPLAVLLNVSLQLLEDAEFDVSADILNDFGEALAERLDASVLVGDATNNATFGGFTGIFVGGTAAAAGGGNNATENLDFEDFTRCLVTVDPIVLARAAKWWTHPQHLVRALSVKDGNGRPIFLTAMEAPTPGAIGSILGYPVVPCYKAPTANVAATKVFVFGDPNGMVVPIGKQFTFETSDHFRWNTLERSFRGWGRAACKIRRTAAFAMLTLTA